MTGKYHPKYVQRLAVVYMEKHQQHGYDVALVWFHSFVPDELKPLVKLAVHRLVAGPPPNGVA